MALEIKEDQKKAWEWAAALAGVTVAQLTQTHLDNQGEVYRAQMAEADRAKYAKTFALTLELPTAQRAEVEAFVLEKLTAAGLLAAAPEGT